VHVYLHTVSGDQTVLVTYMYMCMYVHVHAVELPGHACGSGPVNITL